MKKYIITLALALGFCMNVNAQNDGFFNGNYSEYRENNEIFGEDSNMPQLPSKHGSGFDYSAVQTPLGSGLLILAGLGIAYGMRRRK